MAAIVKAKGMLAATPRPRQAHEGAHQGQQQADHHQRGGQDRAQGGQPGELHAGGQPGGERPRLLLVGAEKRGVGQHAGGGQEAEGLELAAAGRLFRCPRRVAGAAGPEVEPGEAEPAHQEKRDERADQQLAFAAGLAQHRHHREGELTGQENAEKEGQARVAAFVGQPGRGDRQQAGHQEAVAEPEEDQRAERRRRGEEPGGAGREEDAAQGDAELAAEEIGAEAAEKRPQEQHLPAGAGGARSRLQAIIWAPPKATRRAASAINRVKMQIARKSGSRRGGPATCLKLIPRGYPAIRPGG